MERIIEERRKERNTIFLSTKIHKYMYRVGKGLKKNIWVNNSNSDKQRKCTSMIEQDI